jgi:hypothetical protein
MPPDASRLIAYADSRKMAWMWRYRKIGDQWEAEVDLHFPDGGANPRWSGKGDNPQDAVDNATEQAIWYWESARDTQRSHMRPGC